MMKRITSIKTYAARAAMTLLLAVLTTATAWATNKTLSGSEDYTAQNGDVLTGSTSGTVTIASGASITLSGATISGGIVCNGSATITLVGTNSVTGASDKAGIQAGGSGTTLTINGDGSLTVTGGSGYNTYQGAAGIGASYGSSSSSKSICGNITINGGTINATGGCDAAGIGAGDCYSECGNILITGGTVTATGGGSYAAGIGTGLGYSSGAKSSKCGNITITCGTISATKSGSGASHSIGIGKYGTCGTVTIGGVEGYISTSPYNKTIVDDKYTVHFDANGGTGTMSDQAINRGTATALTRNTFTRDGYVFIGWSETADGDVAYTDCKEVTDLAEKDATKTLYAIVNMPIGEATTTITISDVSTKFKIYDDGGKNGNATKGGKGYLTINVPTGYKVSLSGSVLAPETLFSVILIAYDGNSSSAAELGSFYRNNPVSTSSTGNCITLYFWGNGNGDFAGLDLTAEVTPITYNITYNGVDGATFETENPTTYTIESGAITLVNPTREGYTFAGWTGTGLDAATETVTITQGSTGDRSYTATWTENIATLTEAEALAPLTAMSGKLTKVRFTRSGLTAGRYSTICLPYDFTASESCTFYQFVGVKKEGDDWVADVSEYTGALTANTPYIFTTATATSVMFSNDAVTAAASYDDAAAQTVTTDWTFQGTYSQINLPNTDEYDYGFAAGDGSTVAIGTFVHLVSGASAAPFRAYLKYTGSDDNWAKARRRGADTLPSRIIVRVVSAGGETTDIGTLDTSTGKIIPTGDWYSFDGRRIEDQPTQRSAEGRLFPQGLKKGIYINNGKKVIVK